MNNEAITKSGYPAGGLRASDGTRYEVLPSGQIVRRERKMGKAERKRHKQERRQKRPQAGTPAPLSGRAITS
jgi:hypothetical protein